MVPEQLLENPVLWALMPAQAASARGVARQEGEGPNLLMQVQQVGRERLVLDLSCRKRDGQYYVVTDRWQRFSELVVNERTLSELGGTPCKPISPQARQDQG